LAQIIISVIRVRKPTFKDIALSIIGQAQLESKCRRVKRFFKEVSLPEETYARFIVKLLGIKQFKLVIDRTTWFPGENVINFLVLGVFWNGHVIPLFMSLLPKKGNSSFEERKELIKKFIKTFGTSDLEGYLGDREFPGKADFEYLISLQIPFTIRLKKNIKINGKQAKYLLYGMAHREVRIMKGKQKLLGQEMHISVTMSESCEQVIIATLREVNGLEDYRLRWAIEVLFGRLKTRGFNLESTHLRHPERLITLLQVMSIALVFVIKCGEVLEKSKPSKVKKHGYPEESIFRRGLNHLRQILLDMLNNSNKFIQFLHSISFHSVLSRS
jgi:Transposase DDE domain